MNTNRDTKARILEGTVEIFRQNGHLEMSMGDIAKEIGVAKGLLYYYFRTKEDLLQGVVEKICLIKSRHLQEELMKYDCFYEQILIIYDAYQRAYPYRKTQLNMELAHMFHATFLNSINSDLERLVLKGQSEGVLKCSYPKAMIMMTLEGIFSIFNTQELSWQEQTVMIEQALNFPKGVLSQVRRN